MPWKILWNTVLKPKAISRALPKLWFENKIFFSLFKIFCKQLQKNCTKACSLKLLPTCFHKLWWLDTVYVFQKHRHLIILQWIVKVLLKALSTNSSKLSLLYSNCFSFKSKSHSTLLFHCAGSVLGVIIRPHNDDSLCKREESDSGSEGLKGN